MSKSISTAVDEALKSLTIEQVADKAKEDNGVGDMKPVDVTVTDASVVENKPEPVKKPVEEKDMEVKEAKVKDMEDVEKSTDKVSDDKTSEKGAEVEDKPKMKKASKKVDQHIDDDTDLVSSVEGKMCKDKVSKDVDDVDDVEESAMEDCKDCKDGVPCDKHAKKSVEPKEEAKDKDNEKEDKVAKSAESNALETVEKSVSEALAAMTTLAKSFTAQAEAFTEFIKKSNEVTPIQSAEAVVKSVEPEEEPEVAEVVESKPEDVEKAVAEPSVDEVSEPADTTSEDTVAKSVLEDEPKDEVVSKGVSFETEEAKEEVAKSVSEVAEPETQEEEINKSIDEFLGEVLDVKKSTRGIQRNRMRALTDLANNAYRSDKVTKSLMEQFDSIKEIKD